MIDNDIIFGFCRDVYNKAYQDGYAEHINNGTPSRQKMEEANRFAQKLAIRTALAQGVEQFPLVDVAQIWKNVYKVHVYRKTGLSIDEETIEKVISADQSWKKSSGHAFEELIKEIAALSINDSNIKIVLQKDLTILLKAGEIKNEPRDIAWLEKQIEKNIFDLYALIEDNGKQYCYGCIQSKTSIRDRVTRDREPSIHAMQSFFWSVCVVLDGDFLKMPKYNEMVNGGSDEFEENGWHGMYVLSDIDNNDRIYHINFDLDLFITHAIEAANFWRTQRQWLNKDWRAK